MLCYCVFFKKINLIRLRCFFWIAITRKPPSELREWIQMWFQTLNRRRRFFLAAGVNQTRRGHLRQRIVEPRMWSNAMWLKKRWAMLKTCRGKKNSDDWSFVTYETSFDIFDDFWLKEMEFLSKLVIFNQKVNNKKLGCGSWVWFFHASSNLLQWISVWSIFAESARLWLIW